MNQNQALEILVNAVKLATKRGAYELSEVEVIIKAIESFAEKKETKEVTKEKNK